MCGEQGKHCVKRACHLCNRKLPHLPDRSQELCNSSVSWEGKEGLTGRAQKRRGLRQVFTSVPELGWDPGSHTAAEALSR